MHRLARASNSRAPVGQKNRDTSFGFKGGASGVSFFKICGILVDELQPQTKSSISGKSSLRGSNSPFT